MTVVIAANTRTTASFVYDEELLSYKYFYPISVNAINGYIQGTIVGAYAEQCDLLFHNIATSPVTQEIYIQFACFK